MFIFLKYRPRDTTAYSFTIVSSRASLIDSLVTVFPVKECDKICDKTRYVTLEEQIIAPDDVWMVNMKLVVLYDHWNRPKTTHYFANFPPGASGRIRTPNLRIMGRVFYHCATGVPPKAFDLNRLINESLNNKILYGRN
jgi:hypothetical protein